MSRLSTLMLRFLTCFDSISLYDYKICKIYKRGPIKKGLYQSDLALKLSISRPSYIAIEQGKRELTMGEFEKLSSILNVSFDEVESGESPNYEKYKQMILVFLRLGGKMTKTKLAKMLYFADFGWFYSNLKSMSGMQYRRIKYGPVADSYFRIIDEMFDNGEIQIENREDGAMIISQTRSGAKIDLKEINKKEKELIKNIEKKWQNKKQPRL